MPDWLTERVATTPEQVALLFGEQRWTYAALAAEVDGWCGRLAAIGTRPGSLLAVLMPNRPEYVCLVHAAARLGLVLVPLNTRLARPELAWQLAHTGCRWLLCDHTTEAVAADLAEPGREVLSVDAPGRVRVGALAAARPGPFTPVPFRLDSTQAILFTSGTSGRPKAAMITYANHFWSATASAFRLGHRPDDRWLSCLPLYHVGGLAVLFRACLYGISVILHPRFQVATVNDSLEQDGATLVSLVPTMLGRLLAVRPAWPAALRLVLLGGAAAPPELLAAAGAAGVPVATTYGLTEAASQVATLLPAGVRQKPGSVGRPLLFSRVRIADEAGQTVEPGRYGEILVSGPTVMAGYYRDTAATGRALAGGELHTGDIGYLDEDGDLWLVQRRSDIIVSGGENVYPAEVERVLAQHPAVGAACVVGLPHPEWGQQVAALVVLQPGARLGEAELLAFSRQRLAGYKQPRLLRFTTALPLTASGKVARAEVQQALAELL